MQRGSPKRRKLNSSTENVAELSASWPADRLPVEIFNHIALFLPRASVQNMRLVNHEFEQKLSELLFRTVVVPFRSEIYGISEELAGDDAGDGRKAALMLQDKGMRVFQGFGRHIRRFAMSFEVDYAALSMPPKKSNQEAITSYWGIYRWPFSKYNRYAHLEGLEQIADETRTMTQAFKCISNAQELALSMDGGLGWIQGPDINPEADDAPNKKRVFGDSRFPSDSESAGPVQALYHTQGPLTYSELDNGTLLTPDLYSNFQRMLVEAGYRGEYLEQSLRTLLESEGLMDPQYMPLAVSSSYDQRAYSPGQDPGALPHTAQGIREFLHARNMSIPRIPRVIEELVRDLSQATPTEELDTSPLKGEKLTKAQKEMLLEVEWAQRAFIHSYTIAIIDNPITFGNVTKFTIARLSSRHVSALRRNDFWSGLPKLETLSLAVIPDWRKVSKLPTSWVDDTRLAPSDAIPDVFHLLNDHVAACATIKSLHFEWLCGGEEAMGLFARNQLILAAPFVATSMEMVTRVSEPPVLKLPHIQDFSTKNCWTSPHILSRLIKRHSKLALKVVSLESVSLCAHCPPGVNPKPLTDQGHHPQQNHIHQQVGHQGPPWMGLQSLAAAAAAQQPLQPMPTNPVVLPASQPSWLGQPPVGSWAQIIDDITLSLSLAAQLHRRDSGAASQSSTRSKLNRIVFESCGYICLPLDLDQSAITDGDTQHTLDLMIAKRRRELEGKMMKVHDSTLGTIICHMPEAEVLMLHFAGDFREGWSHDRYAALANLAAADGIKTPGQGRFSGSILGQAVSSSFHQSIGGMTS